MKARGLTAAAILMTIFFLLYTKPHILTVNLTINFAAASGS
jgi:hypothetical protein